MDEFKQYKIRLNNQFMLDHLMAVGIVNDETLKGQDKDFLEEAYLILKRDLKDTKVGNDELQKEID